jgi:signal peptidase I
MDFRLCLPVPPAKDIRPSVRTCGRHCTPTRPPTESAMNYLQRRDRKKKAKMLLHDAFHGRSLREDVANPALVAAQIQAEKDFEQVILHEDARVFEEKANALGLAMERVYPPAKFAKARGWVEVILVAFAVAWGFRTFFFQPYKIPTGSMQPTLYGITGRPAEEGTPTNPVYWAARFLLTGESLKEVKAQSTGLIRMSGNDRNNFLYYRIGDQPKVYQMHAMLPTFFEQGQRVQKGQVLARGIMRSGDHLFVNRIKYNFMRPQRGEVVVFRTEGIEGLNQDDYYIKRLVGLPGETMAISPKGYLTRNGAEVMEPASFRHSFHDRFVVQGRDPRMHVDEANGVIRVATANRLVALDNGPYVHEGSLLSRETSSIPLTDRQYLFFGDNTTSSQDGRYFGGVDRNNITGSASLVMWPFVGRAQLLDWRK